MKTFAAFYIVFGILVAFNVIVSMDNCKDLLSITFWIGKIILHITIFIFIFFVFRNYFELI